VAWDSKWQELRCPRCWRYGFTSADEYGDHLLGCSGNLDWKDKLTPDDIVFLKIQRIDPEVDE
jgi:hypothetical protein